MTAEETICIALVGHSACKRARLDFAFAQMAYTASGLSTRVLQRLQARWGKQLCRSGLCTTVLTPRAAVACKMSTSAQSLDFITLLQNLKV